MSRAAYELAFRPGGGGTVINVSCRRTTGWPG